jgi:hypothetical protein
VTRLKGKIGKKAELEEHGKEFDRRKRSHKRKVLENKGSN